jgi:putative endonuclease
MKDDKKEELLKLAEKIGELPTSVLAVGHDPRPYYLYILRCNDNSLYTGIALDVEKRLKRHKAGKGSKYTRNRQPLTLVYSREIGSQSDALKEEYRMKQLNKAEKEKFIYDNTYSFSKRQKEKQLSRDEDQRAIEAGEISREELGIKNSFLPGKNYILKIEKIK